MAAVSVWSPSHPGTQTLERQSCCPVMERLLRDECSALKRVQSGNRAFVVTPQIDSDIADAIGFIEVIARTGGEKLQANIVETQTTGW